MDQRSFANFTAVCLHQTRQASAHWALVAALAAGALTQAVSAQKAAPVISSDIPEAKITVAFPSAALRVGEKKPFLVSVTPTQGQPPPARVRVRFGMPDHGHWVTGEESSDFRQQQMEFNGEFPMSGLYRLRIWLDYDDGRESKTAVDFSVDDNKPLDPKIVP